MPIHNVPSLFTVSFERKKNHCLKMKSLDFSSTNFPPFVSGLRIIYSILRTSGRPSKKILSLVEGYQSCSYENDESEYLPSFLPSVYISHSVNSFALNMSVVRNYIFPITLLRTEAVLKCDQAHYHCMSVLVLPV